MVLVGGLSVGFDHTLVCGDRVDVYPAGVYGDDDGIIHLQPQFAGEARFVLDGHLGKLAAYMRLMGFDTQYRNDWDDTTLAEISSREKRILLTRDRGLLKRGRVKFGYWVRSKDPKGQLVEILDRFRLGSQAQPFSRCARCNGLLQAVEKASVFNQLEKKTQLFYDEFHQCQQCGQVYWKGSHFNRMENFISNTLAQVDGGKTEGVVESQ